MTASSIAGEPIVFVQDQAPDDVPQLAMPWRGVLKLPSQDPQLGIELELWPDSRAFVQMLRTGEPVAMTRAFEPLIRFTVWSGRLTDPAPLSLDTTNMRRAGSGIVGADQTVDLATGDETEPGGDAPGLTIAFSELRKYSVLQVSRDAGVPMVLGRGYPHPARAAAGPVRLASQGVGASRSGRGRDGAQGRGLRAAAQGAVRRRVPEVGGRARPGSGRGAGPAGARRWGPDDGDRVGEDLRRRLQRGAVRVHRRDDRLLRLPGVPARTDLGDLANGRVRRPGRERGLRGGSRGRGRPGAVGQHVRVLVAPGPVGGGGLPR